MLADGAPLAGSGVPPHPEVFSILQCVLKARFGDWTTGTDLQCSPVNVRCEIPIPRVIGNELVRLMPAAGSFDAPV